MPSGLVIGVIDGQGGGIGSHIIKKLREELGNEAEIVALGTNAIATAAMMKAKANRGACGENAILHTAPSLGVILGPLAITIPNSMMGEITPAVARAVSCAPARKILLPLKIPNLELAGFSPEPLPHLVTAMLNKLKSYICPGDEN